MIRGRLKEVRGRPSRRYATDLRLMDLLGDQPLGDTHRNREVSVRVHGVLRVPSRPGGHHHTGAKTPPRNLAKYLHSRGDRLTQSTGIAVDLRQDFWLYRMRRRGAVLLVWLGPSLRWSAEARRLRACEVTLRGPDQCRA